MHVLVDGATWSNVRGFGRFTRELLGAIATQLAAGDRLTLLVDPATAERGGFPARIDPVVVPVEVAPGEAASAEGARSIRDLWAFRRAAAAIPADVVFFPAVYSYFPVAGRTPVLVTFHDAIAEKLPRHIFPTWRGRLFWRLKCIAAARRARTIVTVSEASRRDVTAAYGLEKKPFVVIPEGFNAAVFHPRRDAAEATAERKALGIGPDTQVLLTVGGLSPHKNLDRLLAAFAELVRRRPTLDAHVALCGADREDVFFSARARLVEQVRQSGIEPRVTFTGFVPDARLGALYRLADALVFPSLLEGFGLPALEAMASGTAVVASRRGSLPEVLGEAAFYFDAESTADLGRALETALLDGAAREKAAQAGLKRTGGFTWDRAAAILLQEFRQLAGR